MAIQCHPPNSDAGPVGPTGEMGPQGPAGPAGDVKEYTAYQESSTPLDGEGDGFLLVAPEGAPLEKTFDEFTSGDGLAIEAWGVISADGTGGNISFEIQVAPDGDFDNGFLQLAPASSDLLAANAERSTFVQSSTTVVGEGLAPSVRIRVSGDGVGHVTASTWALRVWHYSAGTIEA